MEKYTVVVELEDRISPALSSIVRSMDQYIKLTEQVNKMQSSQPKASSNPIRAGFSALEQVNKDVKTAKDMANTLKDLASIRNLGTAATAAHTVAETGFVAATTAAAGATRGLTMALSSNPLFIGGVILASILSSVLALKDYNSQSDIALQNAQRQAKSINDLRQMKNEIDSTYLDAEDKVLSDAFVAENYLHTIEQLDGVSNQSKEQKNQLGMAVNGLKSVYPGLELSIDAVTGKLSMNSEEIKNNIANLENLAQAYALMDRMTDTYKLIYKTKDSLSAAKDEKDMANAILNQEKKNHPVYAPADQFAKQMTAPKLSIAEENANIAEKKFKGVEDEHNKYLKTINDTKKEISQLSFQQPSASKAGNGKITFTANGGNIDSIGRIKNDVAIAEDDIKLLKDVAAKEFALKYSQIIPQMSVSFGDVRETADVGSIMTVLEEMTAQAMQGTLIGI